MREFGGRQRREARIAESRGDGIGADILIERAMGFERADAAAQRAVLRQRDEGGAGQGQRGMGRFGLRRLAELVADGKLTPWISRQAPWTEIGIVARDLLDRRYPGKAVLHLTTDA